MTFFFAPVHYHLLSLLEICVYNTDESFKLKPTSIDVPENASWRNKHNDFNNNYKITMTSGSRLILDLKKTDSEKCNIPAFSQPSFSWVCSSMRTSIMRLNLSRIATILLSPNAHLLQRSRRLF